MKRLKSKSEDRAAERAAAKALKATIRAALKAAKLAAKEAAKAVPPLQIPSAPFSHDILSAQETGRGVTHETYASILRSEADINRQQVIMNNVFRQFSTPIELEEPTNIFKRNLLTSEMIPLYKYKRSNFNPKFVNAQSRKRSLEFRAMLKYLKLRPENLHYFTAPALDSRVPFFSDFRSDIQESKSHLGRVIKSIHEKFSGAVDVVSFTLEMAISDGSVYFHYNILVHVPEKIIALEDLPLHDRGSDVWWKSGVSFSRRGLGFGQFLDEFSKLYRDHGERFLTYNGPVSNIAKLLSYIYKPFEPGKVADRPDVVEWLYNGMFRLNTYQPKGTFKRYMKALDEAGQVVFGIGGEPWTRKKMSIDLGDRADPDRARERQESQELFRGIEDRFLNPEGLEGPPGEVCDHVENRVVGRISPTYYYSRKTPWILVQGYNEMPKTDSGKRNLANIKALEADVCRYFAKNAPDVNVKALEIERQVTQQVFIYTTLNFSNYSDLTDLYEVEYLEAIIDANFGEIIDPDIDFDNDIIPDGFADIDRFTNEKPPELVKGGFLSIFA